MEHAWNTCTSHNTKFLKCNNTGVISATHFHYAILLVHHPYVLTWHGYYKINTTNTGINSIILVYNKLIINYVTVSIKLF
jgi:hypothetical protein